VASYEKLSARLKIATSTAPLNGDGRAMRVHPLNSFTFRRIAMSTTNPSGQSYGTSPVVRSSFVPNAMDYIALLLVIVGGLNWLLVGAFNFDLVARIFGEMTTITRAVYILVGLSALYCLSFLGRFSRRTT
jgi:uncharacterized protein